jgi:Protein of unknown function (DUF1552)
MFITKKHIPRRMFLRGMGVAVALPLLDSMIPASTAIAQTAASPKLRMGFIYFPHGAIMDRWTPATAGKDFQISPILQPLEPYKKQLTVVSGLDNKPGSLPPVHALKPGTWLNCVSPRKSQEPFAAITIDQLAASRLGQDTPFPSLEIATETRGGGGTCDRNYGCSYSGTISFRTPTTPLPMEANPRNLFQRLFGQGDTPEERARLGKQYASILDVISKESNDLKRRVGADDRVMLDDYLETIREIERRVQKMEARDLSSLDLPDAPAGIPNSFDEHLNLMFDLVALAYRANLTRVFSMMMAAEVSQQSYNHIGVPDAFHPLSHHQNDKNKMDKLVKIQTYHTSVFAKFLAKLSTMPDGDGSILDHSIILYGSNMSNSNAHNLFPLPSAIVGGGNGKLKGNQHIVYPDHTPLANLLLTLMNRAEIPVKSVGDSTGEISEV